MIPLRAGHRTMVRSIASIALVGIWGASGCSNELVGPPAKPDPHVELTTFEPVGCMPSSESVRTTIFGEACAGVCHGADKPAVGLDLTSQGADALVGKSALGCEGHALVVPGSPELSFLYEKVASERPSCGDRMPIDMLLSETGKACLADWIRGLAPDGTCDTCGGSECVVLAADPANCGSCGNACESGLACVSGECACSGGGTRCDTACVDTSSDAENCGECGNACPSGSRCVDGACECPAPTIACDGACLDPRSDASHCGSCDNACSPGSACIEGECACAASLSSCSGDCVDLASDPEHCGDCETACGSNEVCLDSACAAGCGTLTQCGASCVDTTTSTLHCGACDAPCAAGLECRNGRCECPGGETLCGSACVDMATDPLHCGSCGRSCGSGETCTSGTCSCDASSAVSFSATIAPSLEANCAGSGCHSGIKPKENLLLTAAAAYDELVGVASGQCSNRKLVDPGNPSGSYLMNKLLNVDICSGTQMPKAGVRIPQAELDAIGGWICAGAPRN
jgi:hypothetical protein